MMKREIRVSSVVRIEEKQLDRRLGGVLGIRSAVQVGEKQLDERSSGVMEMRSTLLDSRPR